MPDAVSNECSPREIPETLDPMSHLGITKWTRLSAVW